MLPLLAASLSFIPGAGHLAVGRRNKAMALFVVDAGMIGTLFFVKSRTGHLLILFVYLLNVVPAVIETYALAKGSVSQFSESKPYIVALLLITGVTALPLLWQSHVFSRRNKILWSLAVPLMAVLFFGFLGVYGMRLLNYAQIKFV